MKSGGPWNLRGLRPETREAARDAARRSGVSVGEWLNNVIRQDDGQDHDWDNDRDSENYGEPMRSADYDDDEGVRRVDDREPHHANRRARRRRARHAEDAPPPQHQRPRAEHGNNDAPWSRRRRTEREVETERETALAREEFGEVHARLDRLTQQLERMARTDAPRLTGAPAPQPQAYQPQPLAYQQLPQGYQPPPSYQSPPRSRHGNHVARHRASVSVDNAVAEIAERQRQLYGDDTALPVVPVNLLVPAAPVAPIAPAVAATPVAEPAPPLPQTTQPRATEPALDIGRLDEQLRAITTRIEALRPSSELESVVKSFRKDLSEIREQLTGALPRRAVESLEAEVQALAKRLDQSRASGVDLGVLAGIEAGLKEVRDALRNLTPAENLAGFDDTVKALSQKVDLIIAKEDPAALQQLETAIGALRGIVSHVASNDTLTKVAEDVRLLTAKVDVVATSAASGQALSVLEGRIDTLANALNASSEAGRAVPRELEKLLSGLIEKLEWVQLTHTDHAALGALEDRIAQLIKRLDASDARLGNLEAVERGIADLLVHIEQIRGGNGARVAAAPRKPVEGIERDVAEIKRSERRTQDSLEAVHGAVEQVVDRLAMIESGMHEGVSRAPAASDAELAQAATRTPARQLAPASAPAPAREPTPDRTAKPTPGSEAKSAEASTAAPAASSASAVPSPATAVMAVADVAARRAAASRTPIDPSLPPDHPLEPGSAAGTRPAPSAAERIAASEAAVEFAKPAVTSEQGAKPNFIAAARRAAQAAAAAPPERQARGDAAAANTPQAQKPSRLRKLLVVAGAVLIAGVFVHVALRMFQDRGIPTSGSPASPSVPAQEAPPPKVFPGADSKPESGPLVLPVPSPPPQSASPLTPGTPPAAASAATTAPAAPTPIAPPSAAPSAPAAPPVMQRQSSLPYATDITGSLPRRVPPPAQMQPPANVVSERAPTASAPSMVTGKLPATIGGPKLRAAAIAGNAAAEFEVANRFAEGHGVPQSDAEAVRWLELAAKQSLAPAQFRLGAFYEKGIAVKQNLAVARDLYAAAAAKGNGKAMHNLAVLYAEGINGPADYRTAAQWFHKAADRGITDSQYNLAILYARGIGVAQNYAESYKWFALAAGKGDSDAAKKRDEVAAHLDAQALAAAKLAVQKWAAEPQPEDAIDVKAPPGGWDAPEHAELSTPRSRAGKPLALETKLN
jgi:localization factor PodJL